MKVVTFILKGILYKNFGLIRFVFRLFKLKPTKKRKFSISLKYFNYLNINQDIFLPVRLSSDFLIGFIHIIFPSFSKPLPSLSFRYRRVITPPFHLPGKHLVFWKDQPIGFLPVFGPFKMPQNLYCIIKQPCKLPFIKGHWRSHPVLIEWKINNYSFLAADTSIDLPDFLIKKAANFSVIIIVENQLFDLNLIVRGPFSDIQISCIFSFSCVFPYIEGVGIPQYMIAAFTTETCQNIKPDAVAIFQKKSLNYIFSKNITVNIYQVCACISFQSCLVPVGTLSVFGPFQANQVFKCRQTSLHCSIGPITGIGLNEGKAKIIYSEFFIGLERCIFSQGCENIDFPLNIFDFNLSKHQIYIFFPDFQNSIFLGTIDFSIKFQNILCLIGSKDCQINSPFVSSNSHKAVLASQCPPLSSSHPLLTLQKYSFRLPTSNFNIFKICFCFTNCSSFQNFHIALGSLIVGGIQSMEAPRAISFPYITTIALLGFSLNKSLFNIKLYLIDIHSRCSSFSYRHIFPQPSEYTENRVEWRNIEVAMLAERDGDSFVCAQLSLNTEFQLIGNQIRAFKIDQNFLQIGTNENIEIVIKGKNLLLKEELLAFLQIIAKTDEQNCKNIKNTQNIYEAFSQSSSTIIFPSISFAIPQTLLLCFGFSTEAGKLDDLEVAGYVDVILKNFVKVNNRSFSERFLATRHSTFLYDVSGSHFPLNKNIMLSVLRRSPNVELPHECPQEDRNFIYFSPFNVSREFFFFELKIPDAGIHVLCLYIDESTFLVGFLEIRNSIEKNQNFTFFRSSPFSLKLFGNFFGDELSGLVLIPTNTIPCSQASSPSLPSHAVSLLLPPLRSNKITEIWDTLIIPITLNFSICYTSNRYFNDFFEFVGSLTILTATSGFLPKMISAGQPFTLEILGKQLSLGSPRIALILPNNVCSIKAKTIPLSKHFVCENLPLSSCSKYPSFKNYSLQRWERLTIDLAGTFNLCHCLGIQCEDEIHWHNLGSLLVTPFVPEVTLPDFSMLFQPGIQGVAVLLLKFQDLSPSTVTKEDIYTITENLSTLLRTNIRLLAFLSGSLIICFQEPSIENLWAEIIKNGDFSQFKFNPDRNFDPELTRLNCEKLTACQILNSLVPTESPTSTPSKAQSTSASLEQEEQSILGVWWFLFIIFFTSSFVSFSLLYWLFFLYLPRLITRLKQRCFNSLKPGKLIKISLSDISQDECCSICLLPLKEAPWESGHLLKLPCEHRLHFDCIKKWLTRMPSCPLCRLDLPRGLSSSILQKVRFEASTPTPVHTDTCSREASHIKLEAIDIMDICPPPSLPGQILPPSEFGRPESFFREDEHEDKSMEISLAI